MIRAALLWLLCALPVAAECRLALVLGLDVSGSVDAREYRLQTDGLARALLSPEVAAQILATPEHPIWIAIYEWAGMRDQRLIQDWTAVTSSAKLDAIAAGLMATQRGSGNTATAIGSAINYADDLFARGPACDRRVLDLSGDGTSNQGLPPGAAGFAFPQRQINGLVIGSDDTRGRDERQLEIMELSAYFRRRVIRGPGAFIEVARGFADFERAMTRKLIRETRLDLIGALGLP